MNIIIFEDKNDGFFTPFSINHSMFELRVGAMTNLERIQAMYPNEQLFLIVDEKIEHVLKEKFPYCKVNPVNIPKGNCLNASAVFKNEHLPLINNGDTLSNDHRLISFYLDSETTLEEFDKLIDYHTDITKACNIEIINNLWEIFDINEKMINYDYHNFHSNNNYKSHHSLIRINEDCISIGDNSIIKAGVILDATSGSIIIDSNVTIDNSSIIEGPCYIGKGSYVSPNSLIRKNNTIGPMCKIGGEVSCCNILGYSNKVHDGFLGHSYIGEWVNIGAGTNNSNLKNNYGSVKIQYKDSILDTKLQFFGCLIGDYSRLAIGTNINTGTYIGLGTNLFNHDFSTKYISSFSWGDNQLVKIDSLIETIKKMKKRRNEKVSSSEEQLMGFLYKKISI